MSGGGPCPGGLQFLPPAELLRDSCGGWGHQIREVDVQSIHCWSCGWELCPSGHRCLKGHNPWTLWWTPVVREAVQLKKESLQYMLSKGTPEAVARRRGWRHQSWLRQSCRCGRSLEKLWTRTFGWHKSVSGKPSGTSGGENRGPSKLCTARVGHCWPWLRK